MLKRLLSRWFGRLVPRCEKCEASENAVKDFKEEHDAIADRLESLADKLMEFVDELRGKL